MPLLGVTRNLPSRQISSKIAHRNSWEIVLVLSDEHRAQFKRPSSDGRHIDMSRQAIDNDSVGVVQASCLK